MKLIENLIVAFVVEVGGLALCFTSALMAWNAGTIFTAWSAAALIGLGIGVFGGCSYYRISEAQDLN